MARSISVVLCLALLLGTPAALAGTVGQWSGSDRSWNSGDMSALKAIVEAAGHRIQSDGPVSNSALATVQAFVVAQPDQRLAAGEAQALAAFVQRGGILLLLGETGGTGELNSVLADVASTISFSTNPPANAPVTGSDPAGTGPPYDLVGELLQVTTGVAVTGGTELAGTYVRVERIGSGAVYAFGDRLDHNNLITSAESANARLFVNILAPTLPPPAVGVPALAPGMIWALGAAVVALAALGRRRLR